MVGMNGRSRQRCHVGMGTTAATTTMLLWLTMAAMVASSSSMLFQTRRSQYNGDNCLPGLSAAELQDITVGMSNMSNIYDHLLPHVLVERVSGTQGNILVREFIKAEMSRLGWLVEEDTFQDRTPYGVVTFSNIIATFNPSATRRVVVACHYDSKYLPGRIPFLAATDSAVPCSIMMDIARQLSQMAANALSDFTLQFIFFDGEEAFVNWTPRDSIYGSRHLANLWANSPDRNDPTAANNLENIEFFVLLDLIGTSDTRFVNYYSNTSQLFYRLVNIENCLAQNNLLARRNPRAIFNPYGIAQMVEDDHIPFIRKGVPVLHLISTPFPRVWHTVYDNLHYLDQGLIDDFSRIFRLFLASLFMGV